MSYSARLRTLGAVAAVVAVGCARGEARETGARNVSHDWTLPPGVSVSESRAVATIGNFQGPESVKYDPEQDVFFISNMTGYGSGKDDNGYIARMSAADPRHVDVFIKAGPGVPLNSPKGMAIHGDTLWVADIDVLRGFDRHTGAPLASIDFAPRNAHLLNDVDVGPDGTIRVTDTGIHMNESGIVHTGPDRIFAVGPGGAISEVADSTVVPQPNGIRWDSARERWIVVSFDPFVGRVFALPRSGTPQVLWGAPGVGRLDGVEVLRDGRILFSSWADSSVHLLANGADRKLVRNVPEPADIGVDTKRNRLAIPLSSLGYVELWTIP
jgi:sugar lactone lactonase YvrE